MDNQASENAPELTDSEIVIKSKLIQLAAKQNNLSESQRTQEALEFIRAVIKNAD